MMMDNSVINPPATGTKIDKFSISADNLSVMPGVKNDLAKVQNNDIGIPLLDKLAQLRKIESEKFKKRAKSKFITMGFLNDLIAIKSPLKKSYINTLFCVRELMYDTEKGKMTGKYCNNRWCLVCNRIRTGKLMNGYLNEISGLKEKFMVTLTIPNIDENHLNPTIKQMNKDFRKILDNARKKKLPLDGIRKIECTYNMSKDNYHPHFHIIVGGKNQANFILNEWLKKYPKANKKAQDIRKADDNSIKELFKYFTKVVTRKKEQGKNDYPVFIKPLDTINQAFYGKRVFQPFGKIRRQSEEVEEIRAENLTVEFDGNLWEWVQDQSDWVSEYGEMLTGNDYHKKITVKTS